MRKSTRVSVIAGIVALGLAVGIGVGWLIGGDRGPTQQELASEALSAFTGAWAAGNTQQAGAATDAPGPATAALDELTERLALTAAGIENLQVALDEGKTSALGTYRVTLTLRGLGDWAYDSTAALVKTDERWAVRWAPTVLHPQLTPTTRIGRERQLPVRAPILDAGGQPLMTERPVVTVGIWPAKLTDPSRAYEVIESSLDVDVAKLKNRVEAAKPDAFVEVITLRDSDYQKVRADLRAVPGLVFDEGTRTLAPTREFGRALLGTVAPATEETLEQAGTLASAVDLVGSSGLQLAFQQRLAGSPGGRVMLVERDTGQFDTELFVFRQTEGEPVRVTIDTDVQAAAESALAGVDKPAALVAIKPSTGAILAVANRPSNNVYDRAVLGQYPPGSTFKVVTTAALLTDGLRPDDPVACPVRITVSGKDFENHDGFSIAGRVPFRTDFARSCNTAFVSLADRVAGGGLQTAGAGFGLGGPWELGIPVFTGAVPSGGSPVDHAAAVIGQGQVLASPLAMASVAATVAAGEFHQPYLIEDPASTAARYQPSATLDPRVLAELRELMRAVVTDGSGSALRSVPGNPAAKTGTAEFVEDGERGTHAWMIGFRGDLAFAVLIENGGSGGRDAGPIAARFLEAL